VELKIIEPKSCSEPLRGLSAFEPASIEPYPIGIGYNVSTLCRFKTYRTFQSVIKFCIDSNFVVFCQLGIAALNVDQSGSVIDSVENTATPA